MIIVRATSILLGIISRIYKKVGEDPADNAIPTLYEQAMLISFHKVSVKQ